MGHNTIHKLIYGKNYSIEKYASLFVILLYFNDLELSHEPFLRHLRQMLATPNQSLMIGIKNNRTGKITELETLLKKKALRF